jgi:hypothetical protein
LSFYDKREIKTKLEEFIMTIESKNKKMRVKICLAVVVCLLVIQGSGWNDHCQAGTPGHQQEGPYGPIPENPNEWVCEVPPEPTPEEIAEWCDAHPPETRGDPLPPALRYPPDGTDLEAKNAYDRLLEVFLKTEAYRFELGWMSDTEWRFTGPITGNAWNDSVVSYGTHFPVKVYYSPEVVEWLCNGRTTELPDGAMIVKPMRIFNTNLIIGEDEDGCMEVANQHGLPLVWAAMIKTSNMSYDGWYWSIPLLGREFGIPGLTGDPPLLDKSGITSWDFYVSGDPPLQPEPLWYPSGYWTPNPNKWPNVVTPLNGYGSGCTSCHASAASDSTFASINNLMGRIIRYKRYDEEEPLPGADNDNSASPFTTPLLAPNPDFVAFFDQLPPVAFQDAWEDRLPSQTYDHVVSAAGGADSFLTSDQCMACHSGLPLIDTWANMTVVDPDPPEGSGPLVNLSPFGEWSVSPMGLAGRDPIFYSQMQSEMNNLPELAECIQNTCLHCHGVMGQRQLATDFPNDEDPCGDIFGVAPLPDVPSGRLFALDMVAQWPGADHKDEQKYAGLARDGISCTVCHRIGEEGIGTEAGFTGNFVTTPPEQINGPYEDVLTKPMGNALGLDPGFGEQITDADLCGSCHNILLPIISNEGEMQGHSYEQSTHLEWTNSVYSKPGPEAQTCQECHMRTHYQGEEIKTKIANFESSSFPPTTHLLPDDEITAQVRDRFARHTQSGLNVFLNEIFQQFPLLLGFRQGLNFPNQLFAPKPSLLLGSEAFIDQAQNDTAEVEVLEFNEVLEFKNKNKNKKKKRTRKYEATVKVTNKAGHYLPSGVGFRRLFLEVLVKDKQGRVLWASGRTNEFGAIVAGRSDQVLPSEQPVKNPDAAFQPHYQEITREDQAQIYQELIVDSAGQLTSSFLRRIEHVKDNRIRPHGYDPEFFLESPSPYIQALAETPGQAELDPYYQDPTLTGADVIKYIMDIDKPLRNKVDHIEVTLYSQSIPPFYLQQRFRDANRGPADKDEIERLYYITSHLNVDDTFDRDERSVLSDWKFYITKGHKKLEAKK